LAYLLLCIYNQGPLSRFMYLDTYGILKNYKERFSIVLYELINLSLAWQLAFLYNCTFVSELISQNLFFCRFSPDFWRISSIFGEFRLKGRKPAAIFTPTVVSTFSEERHILVNSYTFIHSCLYPFAD